MLDFFTDVESLLIFIGIEFISAGHAYADRLERMKNFKCSRVRFQHFRKLAVNKRARPFLHRAIQPQMP